VTKESAALLSPSAFLFIMPWTILSYVGFLAFAMHVFGLWICLFVEFCMIQCVAVLNVFVGVEACT
jgi:hypothetical protein